MDTNTKLEGLKQFRETMADKNDFELLGVEESADDAAVRSAYFGLIKLYGADFFHHVVDAESREAIDDVNRRLRAAYDNIGKEAKRKLYIERLHGGVAFEADAHIDIADVFECEQALSQARALMERGEFAIALQKLEKAQKLDKKSMEIRARLAYVHFMLMDVDASGRRKRIEVEEIRSVIEEAAKVMEYADFLHVYLGDIEKLEGDNDKALACYKEALKINAENLQAQREVRLMEERAQKAKEASEKPKSFFEKIKALLTKPL